MACEKFQPNMAAIDNRAWPPTCTECGELAAEHDARKHGEWLRVEQSIARMSDTRTTLQQIISPPLTLNEAAAITARDAVAVVAAARAQADAQIEAAAADISKSDRHSDRSALFSKEELARMGAPPRVLASSKQDASIAVKKTKARWDLCPMNAMDEVIDVLTFGANKHEPDGWRRVPGGRVMYKAALMRHVSKAFQNFEAQDAEMDVSEWAAVAANALILLAYHLEDLKP